MTTDLTKKQFELALFAALENYKTELHPAKFDGTNDGAQNVYNKSLELAKKLLLTFDDTTLFDVSAAADEAGIIWQLAIKALKSKRATYRIAYNVGQFFKQPLNKYSKGLTKTEAKKMYAELIREHKQRDKSSVGYNNPEFALYNEQTFQFE